MSCSSTFVVSYSILTCFATVLLMFAALTPGMWTRTGQWDEADFFSVTKKEFRSLQRCTDDYGACMPFWRKGHDVWIKVVGCLLITAAAFSAIAFLLSIVALAGCGCRPCLVELLDPVAGIAFAGTVVPPVMVQLYKSADREIGYSIFVVLAASALLIFAFVFGVLAVKMQKQPVAIRRVRQRQMVAGTRTTKL